MSSMTSTPASRGPIGKRAAWGAALVAAAVLIAGCTSGEATTASADEEADVASAGSDARNREVVADYEAFWGAMLEASDPADPDHEVLEAHATGIELEQTKLLLGTMRDGNEVMRGTVGHDTDVVSVEETEAELLDCFTFATTVHDAATGEEKAAAPEVPQGLRVTLQQDAGTWKVAKIAQEPSACDELPAPPRN